MSGAAGVLQGLGGKTRGQWSEGGIFKTQSLEVMQLLRTTESGSGFLT